MNTINAIIASSEESRHIQQLLRATGLNIKGERLGTTEQLSDIVYLRRFHIALLDLDEDGWEGRLASLSLSLSVVAFSMPDISKAVRALKSGAFDYIEKPLSPEKLRDAIKDFSRRYSNAEGFEEILGSSPRMQEIFSIVKKAASGDSNVLITGESGTGKELIARAIHRFSQRSERPFVTLNCSAIPDTLIESELFGFEKGAFTGALFSKKGIFEIAHEGTLFFDEIGDVSPMFQSKVLRVLQEGELMRIGGNKQIRVDVRMITATNKNISELIAKGQFRDDLYYRLNVINIHLPPLRNRNEDIPLLVRHFIRKHGPKRRDLIIKGISEEAMAALIKYPFPGNVRELENIIERAVALTNNGEILPSDLPHCLFEKKPYPKNRTPRLREALSNTEKDVILSALNESGWNISRAALLLGVYRQFLQKKIRELSIKHSENN